MLSRVNSCLEPKLEPIQRGDDESMFGGVEESEVVDELMKILVECVKKEDLRGQEILLRKFFFEIEKEIPLQGFLIDRLKHSKIASLFHSFPHQETTTRELNVTVSEAEKLERFKVKTVQVGVVVKQENAT